MGSARISSTTMVLTAILLIGFALRVAYLTVDRFHADEALYAGWALLVQDRDPLLISVPIDKPPLYLYTLAGSMSVFGSGEVAARLPNLAASTLGIALACRLGRRLYDRATGIWAALFVALSPFDILFARTAFTDPTLVLWTLIALCAVAADRWFGAGISLGLAFATKQHAVLLIPLVVTVGLIQSSAACRGESARSAPRLAAPRSGLCVGAANEFALRKSIGRLLVSALGFAIPFGLVVAWDSARWEVHPGYWAQGAMSYGGLSWAAFTEWGERIVEWCHWARYLTGSPMLSVLLLSGCIVLLARGWRRQSEVAGTARAADASEARQTWLDILFVAYAIGYLIVHAIFRFNIWDRYLLPLVPLTGLLLARIVVQASSWVTDIPRLASFPRLRGPTQAHCRGAAEHRPHGTLRGELCVPYLVCKLVCAAYSFAQAWAAERWQLIRRFSPRRHKSRAHCVRPRYQGRAHCVGPRYQALTIFLRVLCASVVTLTATLSGWKAARNGYPVGGEHWAYQGLDQVAAYLKQNAPPDAVLYHHWLRWHYSYYLHGADLELRWWQSSEHLYREATRTPGRAQYIVLPDWRTLEPDAGGNAFPLHLQSVYEAQRQDGSVSMRVYRIEIARETYCALPGQTSLHAQSL